MKKNSEFKSYSVLGFLGRSANAEHRQATRSYPKLHPADNERSSCCHRVKEKEADGKDQNRSNYSLSRDQVSLFWVKQSKFETPKFKKTRNWYFSRVNSTVDYPA